MQRSDEVLDRALSTPERVPSHSTRVGGKEVGPQVQSWKVERAYATDLPEAMRAVSGSSSAQLELLLGGKDGIPAPRLYSAWADRLTGDLVRPGQSVVHTAGAGGRTVPAFRGTVRSRTAASGSDTVTVQALDGAERLRGPAYLPRPYHGYLRGQPVATATWCVDELLRQGGIHSCPPPRAPAVDPADVKPFTALYASLHGGFNATYGQPEDMPDPSTFDWIREGAPFEMALMPKAPGLEASWMPRSRFALPGKVFQVECWVNTAFARGNIIEMTAVFDQVGTRTGYLKATFDIAISKVFITSGTDGVGVPQVISWPIDTLASLRGVWHLGFTVDTSSTGTVVAPTVQPRLTQPDGRTRVGEKATFSKEDSWQPVSELQQVNLKTDMAVECVQVTDRVWTDTATYPQEEWEQRGQWTKGAVLDVPELPLYDIPKVSGSQWDAITEIARASMSTAEFDEQGVFRWRGPSRFTSVPAVPDLTVTTRRDISSLTVTEEIDACRNHCEQPYQDWKGIGGVIGEPILDTAVREIKPNSAIVVQYAMAEDDVEVGPPVVLDDSVVGKGHQVRFGTAKTGGTSVKGDVTVSCWRDGPTYSVRFANHSAVSLWTVTKDGKPSVRLQPIKRTADPKLRSYAWSNSTSQKYYGKQQYTAPSADWVQTVETASALAKAMLTAGRYPVPLLGDVEVLHDPRIQLGDVVRVVDTAGAELDTLAWVVGIRTTHAADGAPQQTLTLRGTAFNGVPADAGLAPDAPVDPAYGQQRKYQRLTAQYATLDALTKQAISYRTLLDTPGGTA
ncbi:hypothetical protein ABZ921_37465 [Streptomyces atriruber]|uniref:Tip attachment protein J domain-containing protein n=1 Tax=Streptomyces atriruber TaxID=545121 RepID=A0ABV3BZ91_9ACTN